MHSTYHEKCNRCQPHHISSTNRTHNSFKIYSPCNSHGPKIDPEHCMWRFGNDAFRMLFTRKWLRLINIMIIPSGVFLFHDISCRYSFMVTHWDRSKWDKDTSVVWSALWTGVGGNFSYLVGMLWRCWLFLFSFPNRSDEASVGWPSSLATGKNQRCPFSMPQHLLRVDVYFCRKLFTAISFGASEYIPTWQKTATQ